MRVVSGHVPGTGRVVPMDERVPASPADEPAGDRKGSDAGEEQGKGNTGDRSSISLDLNELRATDIQRLPI